MNLLLLTSRDRVGESDTFRIAGRRARHLIDVLGVDPGHAVRVGLLDGPLGAARVTGAHADRSEVELRVEAWQPPPARSGDVLVLAVPRPKALRRMLSAATALGFGRIHLTRSWKVEKSHLGSRVLRADALQQAVRDGLEQSRRTHRPEISVHARFTDCLASLRRTADLPTARWVAHPGAPRAAWPDPAVSPRGDLCLALGPDGGWIERELDSLRGVGMEPFGLGDHPLRTETALAAAWGHLDNLRPRPDQ